MSIITLTSDFGLKDYTVAAVKAKIVSSRLDISIVDITHHIKPFNVLETAFLLNGVYSEFPEKTIHLIGVDAEANANQKHLLVMIENQYFIGADNGVFSLLLPENKIQKIIEIRHTLSTESVFPMKDVFVDIALKLLDNKPLEEIGKTLKKVSEWKKINPVLTNPNELTVHIAYVDHFGNLVTDVNKKLFHQYRKNRKFTIHASSAKINKIHQKYIDFSKEEMLENVLKSNIGKAMAVFNSIDLLEIAIYKSYAEKGGTAEELLGLTVGDTIKIKFE
jgi:S-adenosylmethionine hydrolase